VKRHRKSRKIAVVFGTRPEIIKLSSVIRLLHRTRRPYFMIHTGQHYSYEMDRVFFRDLELPQPHHQLSVRSSGGNRHGEHTGRMLEEIERILIAENPGAVLVQGDTNSVLAGSLAAAKLPGVKLGHVEAGLRSYDRQMPEEINRIVSDHLSDHLFAPTEGARRTLLDEGIDRKKVLVTGNTIVDALQENLRLAKKKVALSRWVPKGGKYFLMTLHRQENVDHRSALAPILEGLRRVSAAFRTPILFPIHPRTVGRLKHLGLSLPEGIRPVEPVGFLEFIRLEEHAELILSDSGGVQEEACILRVPCVTLRTTTERPETVEVGANAIAGREPEAILRLARRMIAVKRNWRNPFGDGKSGRRIVNAVEKGLGG